jgi:eukaryotic-like serine/threonine-protein kinase
MIGSSLGRYRIVERLGQGGMGVVFRAEDPRLERDVAIKVIRPETLGSDDVRRRFTVEARALSRLLHPGIATLFDLDAQDGADFLVMEYVPGGTLAELLAGGPLPEQRARAIGIEVAEALQTAHEQGVVHRDLKPSNVAITPRGRAKVLDFGLAHFVAGAGDPTRATTATDAGSITGTVPYMAPEQIQQHPVEARTDVHALGLMLYEMVTGQPAFAGGDPVATLYRIVHEPAPRVRDARPGVSKDFDAIVARCLEKAPAQRYSDAAALARALRGREESLEPNARTDSSGSSDGARSLVVLPFENRSGDSAQEFLADGLTDMLIANLAQIGALRVISRTSAMRFKGGGRALADIARELGVQHVVEGSALRVGDRVRVTVQLVDAVADRSLWAKAYDRDLTDILALQSEVAGAIAEEVRVKVTPAEQVRLQPRAAIDPAAHIAYLRGRYLWNRWSPEAVRESIVCFEEALVADPKYALAYAGISDAYRVLGTTRALPPEEANTKSRAAAEKGLAIDPSIGELHSCLASMLRLQDWNWPAAEREFMRALECNPGLAETRGRFAIHLSCLGRHQEAIGQALHALELDPLSLITYTEVGDVMFWARRFEESVTYNRRCQELDPSFGPGNTDLARALEHVGRYQEALDYFRRGVTRADGSVPPSTGLAIMLWRNGERDEARRVMDEVLERAKTSYVAPFGIASFHAVAGEIAPALDWLERALAERDSTMVFLKVHPRLDGLRGEPRFRTLLARMRLDD